MENRKIWYFYSYTIGIVLIAIGLNKLHQLIPKLNKCVLVTWNKSKMPSSNNQELDSCKMLILLVSTEMETFVDFFGTKIGKGVYTLLLRAEKNKQMVLVYNVKNDKFYVYREVLLNKSASSNWTDNFATIDMGHEISIEEVKEHFN